MEGYILIIVQIVFIIFINSLVGASVYIILDNKNEDLYKWYIQDPTKGLLSFLFLSFWPVGIYFIIKKGEWNA